MADIQKYVKIEPKGSFLLLRIKLNVLGNIYKLKDKLYFWFLLLKIIYIKQNG